MYHPSFFDWEIYHREEQRNYWILFISKEDSCFQPISSSPHTNCLRKPADCLFAANHLKNAG
jgi:hypothetical protein